MKEWPAQQNICGFVYRIEYVGLEQEVDRDFAGRAEGQITWSPPRVIRIFAGTPKRERGLDEILETLIHEDVHGIMEGAPLLAEKMFPGKDTREDALTEFCRLFTDVLLRNGLIVLPEGRPPLTKRTEA